jgi:hypothetical protein
MHRVLILEPLTNEDGITFTPLPITTSSRFVLRVSGPKYIKPIPLLQFIAFHVNFRRFVQPEYL